MITANNILEAIIQVDNSIIQEILDKIDTIIDNHRNEKPSWKTLDNVTFVLTVYLMTYKIAFSPANGQDHLIIAATTGEIPRSDDIGTLIVCGEQLPGILTDPKIAKQFKAMLKTLLEHELVHKEQLIRIKLKQNDLSKIKLSTLDLSDDPVTDDIIRRYLSNPQELMAYAKSTLTELLDRGYTKKDILTHLRSGTLFDIKDVSPVVNNYAEYFSSHDPAMKRFLSYIYQYTQELD
jgi:hypothetical protein